METIQTLATVVPMVTLAVSAAGIALNVPSVLVFQGMAGSVSNSYITVLIVLDTLSLLANLPLAVLEVVQDQIGGLSLALHYFTIYWGLALLMGARHVIFVLTALMSLHRCLSLSFPTKALPRNPLNHPRPLACAVCLLGFAMSTAGLNYSFGQDPAALLAGNATGATSPRVPDLKAQLNDEVLLVSNIALRTVPMAVILASNLALFASLLRHARDTRAAGIDDAETVRRRLTMMRSVKMVLVYSAVFLLLALPIPIYPVVQALRPEILQWEPLLPSFLKVIFPFLEVLSSSSNFFVFFAVSSAFRRDFRVIVTCSQQERLVSA